MPENSFKYNYVMLIDDNDVDNFLNEKTLESIRFSKKIYVNTSASAAFEFLKNISFAENRLSEIFPQVIFIDLNMPVMDGFEFIKCMAGLGGNHVSNFKMVVLTSSVDRNDEQTVKEICKDIIFFKKPLTTEMLAKI